MNWKKRTKEEMDLSVSQRDYTGGYEFWPWLLHMRIMYVIGFFGNLAGGIAAFSTADGDGFIYGIGVFFGVVAPIIIAYMLRKDYKQLKVGQSS